MYKAGRRKKRKQGGGPGRGRFQRRNKQTNHNKADEEQKSKKGSAREGEQGVKSPESSIVLQLEGQEGIAVTTEDRNERYEDEGFKWNFRALWLNGSLRILPIVFDVSAEGGGQVRMDDGSMGWSIYAFYGWLAFTTIRLSWINMSVVFVAMEMWNKREAQKRSGQQDHQKGGLEFTTSESSGSHQGSMSSTNHNELYGFFVNVVVSIIWTVLLYIVYDLIWINKTLPTICTIYNSCLNLRKELPEMYSQYYLKMRNRKGVWRFFPTLMGDSQEMLLNNLPFIVYPLLSALGLFMMVNPSSPILLNSLVVNHQSMDLGLSFGRIIRLEVDLNHTWRQMIVHWNWVIAYIVLGIVDHLFYFWFVSIMYLGVMLMLLVMQRVQLHSELVREYLLREEDSDTEFGAGDYLEKVVRVQTAIEHLKLLKVFIILFNSSLSLIVYLTKLMTMAGAIVGGFGFIKLLPVDVTFATVFLMFFFEGNIIYTILFNSAYQIGENLEGLKSDITEVASLELGWPRQSVQLQEVKRQMRSIQELGIKAGNFHTIERESSLIFIEFVVEQIVDLLLTF